MNLTPAQVKLLLRAADEIDAAGIGPRQNKTKHAFEDKVVTLLRQIAGAEGEVKRNQGATLQKGGRVDSLQLL